MGSVQRQYFWVSLFSIAMGFLETAVVVYLRALYYPDGFDFPLVDIDLPIAITELGREAATIIMLVGIGVIAGQTSTQRFAWFLYSFAIWDIFYYVFLKVILDWPASLFTWDILFLIPLPWVGPVICPVIISASMILLSVLLIHFNRLNSTLKLNPKEWMLFISGSVIVILSFIIEPYRYIKEYSPEKFPDYIPVHFDWWIFWLGEALILSGIILFYVRGKSVTLSEINS